MGEVGPALTVVIATYNRFASVERLLAELARQTVPATDVEVVVVDDGSTEPVVPRLASLSTPYRLTVLAQSNAGPAAARDRAIRAASGAIIVCLDDDMRVGPDFLAAHLRAHPAGSRHVVLGRLHPVPDVRPALHDRVHLALLDRLAERSAAGEVPNGSDLYTGNVSFRRADYLAVGGFDLAFRLSEDAELGIRLEQSGATFRVSDEAASIHDSDRVDVRHWMRRTIAYGAADAQVADKHPDRISADPWRFLFLVHPISRPLLLSAVLAARPMRFVASLAMWMANGASRLGAERIGIAGATLTYGILYFTGVREHAGSRRAALKGLVHHLNVRRDAELGLCAKTGKLAADIYADHLAIRTSEAKYKGAVITAARMPVDFVQRIGFQMMCAYRLMRYLRAIHLGILARIASRVMRHLYGADIHWDAELAPGVVLVHGVGLVIGHGARVGPGCILFQHVTLGMNIHPESREVGTPTLEANVHVGPGATLLGPITIGRESKLAAGVVVMRSVPARSLVENAAPVVRARVSRHSAAPPDADAGEDGATRDAATVAAGVSTPQVPEHAADPASMRRTGVTVA
jgi:serine acetyltransferase/GT2 family glycosyltransferase